MHNFKAIKKNPTEKPAKPNKTTIKRKNIL